jgi:hypothetical protein
MLLDSTQAVQYFIRLPSGQEIGPYTSAEQARISLATMPVFEGGEQATVFPKTVGGAQVLFG